MARSPSPNVFYLLLILCFSTFGRAESAQYCLFNNDSGSHGSIAFCMSTHMYHNRSTQAHDMYLTMTVNRPSGSSTGWTAIGLGETMTGSLMFIIYGDPLSKGNPVVSIRKSTGHAQPTLLSKSDLPVGMDLRVVRSSWLPGDVASNKHKAWASHSAIVSLVCYSCHLWPETAVSASTESQPWIWAWNPSQVFDEYTFDAHLKMHKHHPNTGGWGLFYTNMKKTISEAKYPPSLPPIVPDIPSILSSSRSLSLSSGTGFATNAKSFAHGTVMSLAFLLLFPAGVIGMRSGSPKSYTIHWALQLSASIATLIGMTLGLMKPTGREINTTHQYIGMAVTCSLGMQGLLGWWHHRRFIRLRRRTWVSHAHIWLGRIIIPLGWVNVVGGLLLRGYGRDSTLTIAAFVIVCIEAVVLTLWVWRHPKNQNARQVNTIQPSWANRDSMTLDRAFSVGDETDEEDETKGSEYGGDHEGDNMICNSEIET